MSTTADDLIGEINADLPTNNQREINAAILRQLETNIVNRVLATLRFTAGVSVLEFIPSSEWPAIQDYTSVFDCSDAFQAAHDSLSPDGSERGGKIIIPTGLYNQSRTWAITKRLIIEGDGSGDQISTSGTSLVFASDITGIHFYDGLTSANGASADRSIIRSVNISAVAGGSSGHGIQADCPLTIDECIVRDFGGDGIHIVANAGLRTGNANGWKVSHVRLADNNGNGIFVSDSDANAGLGESVDTAGNGGWGIWDDAKFANTWINCQAANNLAGSYKTSNNAVGAVFLNCYVEGDSHFLADLHNSTLVLGGTLAGQNAAVIYADTSGNFILGSSATNRTIFQRNGVETGRIETDNKLKNFTGTTYTDGLGNSVNIDFNLITITSITTSQIDLMRFANPNGTVGRIQTDTTTTTYKTTS